MALFKMSIAMSAMALVFSSLTIVDAYPANTTSYWAPKAALAVKGLMSFYNKDQGRFDPKAPWYQTGTALQALLDYTESDYSTGNYSTEISNIFDKQRGFTPMWETLGGDFHSGATADTAWWALAELNQYRRTGDKKMLDMARGDEAYIWSFFNETSCGGGITSGTTRPAYHNAISNELYIELATTLHNAIPGEVIYLQRAERAWKWLQKSGLINHHHLINDGLSQDGKCENKQVTPTWTHNQGVILGGLLELYKATKKSEYKKEAHKIIRAVIKSPELVRNGVLIEPCTFGKQDCEKDVPLYKGVFVRYLWRWLKHDKKGKHTDQWLRFLRQQGEEIYDRARHSEAKGAGDFYGFSWDGPFDHKSLARQTSAVSLLTVMLEAGIQRH